MHRVNVCSDNFQVPKYTTSKFQGGFMYVGFALLNNYKVFVNASELRFKSGIYKTLFQEMTLQVSSKKF